MNASKILALALAACALTATPAMAGVGVKLGAGVGVFAPENDTPDPDSISTFAVGLSYGLSLVLLDLEVDALYFKTTASFGPIDAAATYLAVPVIGRFNLPLVPALLNLGLGAGLEPRFFLGAQVDGKDVKNASDQNESMVLFLPISAKATLDLQLASVSGEIRYSHQLTASSKKGDDDKIHSLMFFAGAAF